jgi:hypothetical protein
VARRERAAGDLRDRFRDDSHVGVLLEGVERDALLGLPVEDAHAHISFLCLLLKVFGNPYHFTLQVMARKLSAANVPR